MSRKTTFFEFAEATKAKWQLLAKRAAGIANHASDYNPDKIWTKDEILDHIELILDQEGDELPDKMRDTYFERVRMASVYNGTSEPTLDLINDPENGFCYKWLREDELPSGFLNHILGIAGGMPRLAFDYFVLLAKEYKIDMLVTAIGAKKAMTLLLLAELYVRISKASPLDADHNEAYLSIISEMKIELQSRITEDEARQFNSIMGTLMLTSGDK